MSRTFQPVACFSYLAAAELWQGAQFPLAHHGTEVLNVERFNANGVGNDQNASDVRAWLQRYRVDTTAKVKTGATTPKIVVVADDDGTRTWFPHLPGVSDALAAVDLSSLFCASFAYIDCYQLIEAPAVRAIQAARSAGVPLVLNLGGSPLSSAVIAAVRGYPGLIIQTNVDDAAYVDAPQVARAILAATGRSEERR